jgi:cytoskeletal protein RodZ
MTTYLLNTTLVCTLGIATRARSSYPYTVLTVGEQLRKAREAQKLDVQEIVDQTKIRGDHLRALEEGNYSVFSAPVYIRGFVRTYATLLKLDTAQILEQLGQELADSGQVDPMLAPPQRSILDSAMFQLSKFSRRMVWPAAGAAAVLLVVAGSFFLWTHFRNEDPTAGLGAGLYQWPANSGDTLPLPVKR